MLLSSRGGAERTAATVGIKFFLRVQRNWTTETLVNVCVNIMSASMYGRETVCVCLCVCVLARRAASSGGRGLWFIIDDLYAPPT